jgi:hypothetical protein
MSLEPTPQEDRPHTLMYLPTLSLLYQLSYQPLCSHTLQPQFPVLKPPGAHIPHLHPALAHTKLQTVALLPTNMSLPQLVMRLSSTPPSPLPTVDPSPMLTPSTAQEYQPLTPHLPQLQPPHQVATFHTFHQPPQEVLLKLSLTQPTIPLAETLLTHSLSPLQAVPLDQELLRLQVAQVSKLFGSLVLLLVAQAEPKLLMFPALVKPSTRLVPMPQAKLAL